MKRMLNRKRKLRRLVLSIAVLLLGLIATQALADPIIDQWRQGLAGARLTAYSGSVISSNSTLTVVRFCRNGRYSFEREGSWSLPGQAGGASQSRITGRWDVGRSGSGVVLLYQTDDGRRGRFEMFLQRDGRVNIGGLAYQAERGAAGC